MYLILNQLNWISSGNNHDSRKRRQQFSDETAFHSDIPATQIAQNGLQSQLPSGLLHFIHKVHDGCPARCCEAMWCRLHSDAYFCASVWSVLIAGQKESGMYSLTDEGDNTLSLDEMMPDSILISNLINPGRKSMFSVCGRRQYFYQQWLKSSFISSGTSCRFWFRHIISDPYIFRTLASVLARHTRIPASREVPVLVSMFWQGGAGRGWGGGEYSEEEGLLLCLLRGCEWCIDVVVWSNGHVKPWQLAAEQNCIS